MPFDGVVTKSVYMELSEKLSGGRVEKIFQPETDEIVLNIRAKGENLKLLLSASANYPRIHLTEKAKENPTAAPVFCMLLRKHLSGGKITGVEFIDFERIIAIQIESTNELGDLTVKKLIIEIMGRHSNIILVNNENKILDSIKHVDSEISSVREVMPARAYLLPPSQNKTNPESLDIDNFFNAIGNGTGMGTGVGIGIGTDNNAGTGASISTGISANIGIEKYLLEKIKGFSPLLCREICYLSDVDGRFPASSLPENSIIKLKETLKAIIEQITNNRFNPCIIYSDNALENPLDYHCLEIRQYANIKHIPSISSVLDSFYSSKDGIERLKQRKADVTKVLGNSTGRCKKKLALQQEKLREISGREKLKLYGELITANIYCIPKNVKSISLPNYYSENNEHVEISLDENKSPQENAQRYFKQYTKAKSAFTNTNRQLGETNKELDYLESVLLLLENCTSLLEIEEVRQELLEQGYLSARKKSVAKKTVKSSAPFHYKSIDGFDIYVGKNNKQNDLLTLKSSSSNDMWLHTRNIPGSHVIIKKENQNIPESTLLGAAVLAAYHSKAKMSSNVAVDYTSVKNVKKPPGAKPGMVIYDNFKTIIVTPEESVVKKLRSDS